MTCSNCGKRARIVRDKYVFSESGLSNVLLSQIEIVRCDTCGNCDPVICKPAQLMKTIALSLVRKPHRLLGPEVRFLRKHLGMTGEQFARILHVDKTTLSKWENDDDPIGLQSDLLIRAVTVSLIEEFKADAACIVRAFDRITESREVLQIDINAMTFEYVYHRTDQHDPVLV